jgi:hypothetical protein
LVERQGAAHGASASGHGARAYAHVGDLVEIKLQCPGNERSSRKRRQHRHGNLLGFPLSLHEVFHVGQSELPDDRDLLLLVFREESVVDT